MTRLFLIFILAAIAAGSANAQIASGGAFVLEKSAVANGGGKSSGGAYEVNGTAGQSAAGNRAQNPAFSQPSGFWVPDAFVPTAAGVTIRGRVATANGAGIRNAVVTLTDSLGVTRTATTATFGNYVFTDVAAGENYTLTVISRKFTFLTPTVLIAVADDVAGLDFTAIE